ncbi:hypothetical protein B0J12DRAFT_694437 [Macrophomina phaseolina]|uniref:J domain-containing protein n=1 Tax=Macrophomina phaseolina TaxID=35725 RepID=A0ABQ8GSR4_9PEZI|nr:hypothetical protein B0J12DRAFT_694437 [Macrophomina phaseolina]
MSSSNKADDLSDEAKELIKSPHDLYALLGLSPSCDEKAIKSAWRKTSLKYHPDKNQDNPSAVETFYLAKNAAELLQNAEARKKYDDAREAARAREAQKARLEGKRRRLMEELERAETGAKRKREEEVGRESEVKRLARDGERRRREREEAKLREREEEARRERERERRRQSVGVHFQPRASVGAAAAAADGNSGAGTPVKKRVFDGARSAPSTPAGKRPAFSFSPKPGVGGGNKFEQDTLARLKAKQAEKRRLEEQIKAQEAAETTS